MITVPVVNIEGEKVGDAEIDAAHFGGEVNRQLLHDIVVMYQANLRSGTHFTKNRGLVVGSGKKLFRQKGTGNARVGDKRTNKRRGGGVAHGPKPRDYSYALPKKARRLATRMALLSKFQDNEAVIVDRLELGEIKTRRMAAILAKLGLAGQSCLIATAGVDRNVVLSARNIDRVEILPAGDLNALALLKQKRLLLTRDALESLKAGPRESD